MANQIIKYGSQTQTLTASQGQFLSTFNLSDFGFGEETVGNEGSGAHIDAAVDVFTAEITEQGGFAYFLASLITFGLPLLTAQTGAPLGQKGLLALAQKVGEVKLPVRTLVLGEIVGEEKEHSENRQFSSEFPYKLFCGQFNGFFVERFTRSRDGKDAHDVVDDDVVGQPLAVNPVNHGEGNRWEDQAFAGIGDGCRPVGRCEIGQYMVLRREALPKLPGFRLLQF